MPQPYDSQAGILGDAHVGYTVALLGKLGSLMCGFHMAPWWTSKCGTNHLQLTTKQPWVCDTEARCFRLPSLIYPQPTILQLWFMHKEAYAHPFILVQYKIHALDDWTMNIKQFSISMRSCNLFWSCILKSTWVQSLRNQRSKETFT